MNDNGDLPKEVGRTDVQVGHLVVTVIRLDTGMRLVETTTFDRFVKCLDAGIKFPPDDVRKLQQELRGGMN